MASISSRTSWIRLAILFWSASISIGNNDSVTDVLQFLPAGGYDRIVYFNDNYVVSCFAPENITAVRVTWKGPRKEIKEKQGRIHIENNAFHPGGIDLFFEGLKVQDQGDYECSAIVDGQTVKKSFKLHVYKKIKFTDTPDVQYITEGENQNVRCSATAVPDATISWKINGSLPIKDNKHIPRDDEGYLIIRNVSREDTGTYTCRATQADELVSNFEEANINVIVKYKPEWRQPAMMVAYSYVGGVVNLTCEADGEPAPVYSWMRDDGAIILTEFIQIHETKGKSVLEIRVQNTSDFGEYVCSATNSEGFAERSIQLLEGVKPAIPKIEVSRSDTRSIMLDISDGTDGEHQVTAYTIEYKTETQTWDDSKKQEFSIDNGYRGPEAQYTLDNLEPSTSYILRVAARNVVGLSDYTEEIIQRTDKEPSPRAEDVSSLSDSIPNSALTVFACGLLFRFLL